MLCCGYGAMVNIHLKDSHTWDHVEGELIFLTVGVTELPRLQRERDVLATVDRSSLLCELEETLFSGILHLKYK